MATLQETVQAVLAELQKLGTNLQDTDIADSGSDFKLLLGFKEDGTFIRLSPKLLQTTNTEYLTKQQYKDLVDNGQIKEDVEYNIYENE